MKNTKNKFYIAIGSLILIILASIFISWQILFAQFSEAKNEYIAQVKTLEEIEKKTDLRNELKRELEEAGEDINIIQSAFLAEEDKLDFIQQLEELAVLTQNEYNIGGVREITNPKGKPIELEFNIELTGTFQNIIRFMQQLHQEPYLINISQYSFAPVEDGIQANLTFKVYFK
ncbi:MAG: hypothetical protein R3251_01410 [Candidatus Spechtbacterales bacterium]|nr:hypothetical protein [Candidatus Spechtbacterales bacterium]